MREIETLLKEYGLKWDFSIVENHYRNFQKRMDRQIRSYTHKSIPEKKELSTIALTALLNGTEYGFEIEDMNKFTKEKICGSFPGKIPGVIFRNVFLFFYIERLEINFSVSYSNFRIENSILNGSALELEEGYEAVKGDFTESQKIQALFDEKKRRELVADLLTTKAKEMAECLQKRKELGNFAEELLILLGEWAEKNYKSEKLSSF